MADSGVESVRLSLYLFGEFRAICNGLSIGGLNSSRIQALITLLSVFDKTEISRQRIATLFWPETIESQARTNLRQLFHHLRQSFPQFENYIQLNTQSICWLPEADVRIDVLQFKNLLADAQKIAGNDTQAERSALEQACKLYRGDLLPACYDEWIEPERQQLRGLFTNALHRLTTLLEEQGAYAQSIRHAERLLQVDEFDESSYRTLMRLQALSKNRSAALQTYRRCEEMLRTEMDMSPYFFKQNAFRTLCFVFCPQLI